jgi:small subunit ribosomal protein S18
MFVPARRALIFARLARSFTSADDTEDFTAVAKQRNRGKAAGAGSRRRDKKGGAGSGRRKPCLFCKDKVEQVDYKDITTLRRFISERGKIRSRRITGACRRHQNQVARAVKRARELALLPYVAEGGREDSPRGRRDRDREDR